MQAGAITGYIDVAQVALYAFWIFFAVLVFWLRREDKREGYPLVTERHGYFLEGFPPMPAVKTYILPHGGTVSTPRVEPPQPSFDAVAVAAWPGAPMQPIGNAMLAGIGPAASALRAETPDLMDRGELRIVPLRVATDYFLDLESPDPRGMQAAGADGVVGGVVSDIWVDRTEAAIRYLEVTLAAGPSVLVPMPLIRIDTQIPQVNVVSILGAQFEDAPMLANPDQVTLREEDKVQAYFSSGHLYATPERLEPNSMNMKEHDYEPVPGLPAPLPAGETILWQGSPDWRTLARRAMRVRVFAAYFVALIAWGISGGISAGSPATEIAVSAVRLATLGCVALALMSLFAWLVARTTIYTITTRRVVMRFGIALPMTIQIAYPMIDGAGLHAWANGAGDIALTLRPGQRIAYFVLWPHARPWKFARSEPTLRGIPNARDVSQILGRALAASASQPAKVVSVPASALADRGSRIPAAA